MKARRFIAWALVLVLLAGASAALGAAAGSQENPLISKTYVDGSFSDNVVSDARSAVRFTLNQVYDKALSELKAGGDGSTGAFQVKTVAAGSTAQLDLGDCVVLLSGAARLQIEQGSVVNVTVGAEAVSGKLLRNNRYLACEDTKATVTFSEASTIAVDGSVGFTGTVSAFTDVTPANWFYNDVITATQKGLITGKTATTYEPRSNLTVAEAIKLAACLHQLHRDGTVTLQNNTKAPWYRTYVDYAIAQGIIDGEYTGYTDPITRSEFIHIFYHALPESEYAAINTVADGAVPDLPMTASYAGEIYTLYRAGILTGDAQNNQFKPGASILRSEVAATLTRMYDASARKSFTLGG